MTCDKNANGIADEDEPFMLKELTLRDDGTCDRNGKTEDRLQKSFFFLFCAKMPNLTF